MGGGSRAGGKRPRGEASELVPQILLPRKQASDPSLRRSPSFLGREEERRLEELRNEIRQERKQRAALLEMYHENERTLARLQAFRTELMRQVKALKSGAPLPQGAAPPPP